MKSELQKKLLAKIDAIHTRAVALMVHGAEFQGKEDEVWKKLVENTFKPFRKRYEAALRLLPDDQFEAENARLESQPGEIRKTLTQHLPNLPAKRGGRPPSFPKEIRRSAIDDLAHELRNSSFGEAVTQVAARYEMTSDYLRKIWKNRKRLNTR